jgi:hypothetical protein
VQAIIEIIRDLCETEITRGSNRFPFVFFEEAHLYINRNTIGYIVTRARHLGITSFFVTNMIGGLDETVLRQADNLFILRLPFDDDVRHLGKSALTDQETMNSCVRRLRNHHSLLLGDATRHYPIIFEVDALEGINTAGETQYFFQPRGSQAPMAGEPGVSRSRPPQATQSPFQAQNNLPLFPEEAVSTPLIPENPSGELSSGIAESSVSPLSLERVLAQWDQVVERAGRRRHLLETILAAARPIRIVDRTLLVGFPAQHRFHRELLDSPEYRVPVEEELLAMFGEALVVTTTLMRERSAPRRRR